MILNVVLLIWRLPREKQRYTAAQGYSLDKIRVPQVFLRLLWPLSPLLQKWWDG